MGTKILEPDGCRHLPKARNEPQARAQGRKGRLHSLLFHTSNFTQTHLHVHMLYHVFHQIFKISLVFPGHFLHVLNLGEKWTSFVLSDLHIITPPSCPPPSHTGSVSTAGTVKMSQKSLRGVPRTRIFRSRCVQDLKFLQQWKKLHFLFYYLTELQSAYNISFRRMTEWVNI